MMTRMLLCLAASLAVARADFTIVQKVEGGVNSGEMKLRLKGDKARADIAPQVSMITDTATGDVVTLSHAAKVFIRVPAAQAKVVLERVKRQQKIANSEQPKLVATGRMEKVEGHECEVFTWSVGEIKSVDWIAKGWPNFASVLAALDRFQSAGLAEAARPLQPAVKDFPGMLMKREMTVGGVKTTTVLVSVVEAEIDAAVFEVPKDYKEQPSPVFPVDEPAVAK